MNKREHLRLAMYHSVISCLEDRKYVWESLPGFNKAVSMLQSKISSVELEFSLHEGSTRFITKQKRTYEDEMISLTLVLQGMLKSWSGANNNYEVLYQVSKTRAMLIKENDLSTIIYCSQVLKLAEKNKKELYGFGLTDHLIEDFHYSIKCFDNYMHTPVTSIRRKYLARKIAAQHFKKIDRLLKLQIDTLMEQFRNTHPSFYQDYNYARIIYKRNESIIKNIKPGKLKELRNIAARLWMGF